MQIKFIDRKTGKLITETPPGEGLLRFLYDNPFGKTAILPIAKRKFISGLYGGRMDKPSSAKRIQAFVDQLGIDMSESKKAVSEFISFNDFFYRELKPGARPIAEGFVSPGDGKLIAFEKVDEVADFFVKGNAFTLEAFLQDKKLAARYAAGSMLILRLAPNDYHRFHFPYRGVPSDPVQISGSYFSVSPIAIRQNFVRVFCENKREYTILKTEEAGDILLAPVGATMVGGIVETYEPGKAVGKGDEMGFFKFGGSTIVILAEPGALTIDEDLLENTRNRMETAVKMGEQIAGIPGSTA
ncbi:MAG: phosphatidylserine decarboxylase [Bacteroidia bacterium]